MKVNIYFRGNIFLGFINDKSSIFHSYSFYFFHIKGYSIALGFSAYFCYEQLLESLRRVKIGLLILDTQNQISQ